MFSSIWYKGAKNTIFLKDVKVSYSRVAARQNLQCMEKFHRLYQHYFNYCKIWLRHALSLVLWRLQMSSVLSKLFYAVRLQNWTLNIIRHWKKKKDIVRRTGSYRDNTVKRSLFFKQSDRLSTAASKVRSASITYPYQCNHFNKDIQNSEHLKIFSS